MDSKSELDKAVNVHDVRRLLRLVAHQKMTSCTSSQWSVWGRVPGLFTGLGSSLRFLFTGLGSSLRFVHRFGVESQVFHRFGIESQVCLQVWGRVPGFIHRFGVESQDKDMCRELLVLGYHSEQENYFRDIFDEKKAQRAAETEYQRSIEMRKCAQELSTSCQLMQALASREEDNLSGCLSTIIFVRDVNEKGEEVSAYMDYAHRLKIENWTAYFKGEKKVVPLESDLRQVHC
ncbi:cilia- and flagella-associated protein 299 [Caerostris extrusa]|uniref:Cilia- and flagella-associated protein 299 n=1 Tax=Caerostris extrusa TaxID=172846 RepID=A0AAV4PD91_CAEEX|nr:cilia- and flagella-associated protein 299 [Caerostris extrusa]